MRQIIMLCLLFPLAAQANLFKCTDSKGKVTYTNSPCAKVGLTEAKVIPPPPPPAEEPIAKKFPPPPAPVLPVEAPKPPETSKPAVETLPAITQESLSPPIKKPVSAAELKKLKLSSDKCAKLNEDLGKTMDEMDAARNRNTPPKQQAEWNNRLKALQAEKNKLGCF